MAIPIPKAPKPQPGWWSLQKLEGSRGGVIDAIQADKTVPLHWQVCLAETILAAPAELNHVRLDAHCTEHDGLVNINISLRRRKVL